MTTPVTEGASGCRPRFLRLRGFAAQRSRARALPLLNLKKKRDCSQSKTRVKLERKTSIITVLDEQNIVIVMQTGLFLYHLRAPDMEN